MTRRRALATAVSALLTSSQTRAEAASPDGLGTIAARTGILFGSALTERTLDRPDDAALFVREARVVTAENATKFGDLRPGPDRYDFSVADRLVDWAAGNGLDFYGSALIWNDHVPAWVGRLGRDAAARLLDEHVRTVLGRYAGRIRFWGVVNEPLLPYHKLPDGYRDGPWLKLLGPGYVERAYEVASEADPGARLVLNEAWTERDDWVGLQVRRDLLALIDRLQRARTPLHAVGLEAHIDPTQPFDPAAFRTFLAELARRDLAIYVTELDVDDHTLVEDASRRDRAVADAYRRFLDVALAEPAVSMVQTWGLVDRASWFNEPSVQAFLRTRRPARPLPFDDALARKPAWHALADAFARRPSLLGR